MMQMVPTAKLRRYHWIPAYKAYHHRQRPFDMVLEYLFVYNLCIDRQFS
jgi:hypothetical protein